MKFLQMIQGLSGFLVALTGLSTAYISLRKSLKKKKRTTSRKSRS